MFWSKEIGAKSAHKILIKLTQGVFKKLDLNSQNIE